jgi:hypothetical protein
MRCISSAPECEFDTAGKRTRRHAGIFSRHGTQSGRKGFWLIDQFAEHGREVQERFYPFVRRPGERGYGGMEFSVIRPHR